MNEALFVDTSAWFSYINARDPDHERLQAILDAYAALPLTSTYVFDEIVTLTRARLGHRIACLVGKTLLDPKLVTLLHVTPSDERAAWKLFEKRADKSYSFTDCTSFIVMQRQKIGLALTLDHHFAQEGFRTVPA
jgi:predicted nucleic acid-binding protein